MYSNLPYQDHSFRAFSYISSSRNFILQLTEQKYFLKAPSMAISDSEQTNHKFKLVSKLQFCLYYENINFKTHESKGHSNSTSILGNYNKIITPWKFIVPFLSKSYILQQKTTKIEK